MTAQTITGIAPETLRAIALIGRVVTIPEGQGTVRTVEGETWNAFQNPDGTITADFDLTPADYPEPFAFVKLTDGQHGRHWVARVLVSKVRPSVCLDKLYR